MLARGQITVTNLDDGKTPFLHQAYKMKDGRFLKHYPVYEAPPVNGYKKGDLWHRTDGLSPGYFVANKSNTTFDFNDWTFYANELAYSDTDKFYPKFEGTYSDYNEVASDDQTKYTWKIIKADDGIGIKSVKEYYAISTSNITPPSLQSDWSETPKTTDTTNKYLWNYEVYTYSNGDVKETTKRVIGTHGTSGSQGIGVKGVTEYYLASPLSEDIRKDTNGWTTEMQPLTPENKYLWNKEIIHYTDDESALKDKTEVLSGSEIFTDKADADSVVHVEVDGKSYQHAGSGKNLFRTKELKSLNATSWVVTAYVYNFKLKPNTKYTLSSNVPTDGDDAQTVLYFNGSGTPPNGVYDGKSNTQTTDSEGNVFIAIPTRRTHTEPLRNGEYWVQLEEGSTATAYEPPAPSPDYPIEIHSLNDFDVVSQKSGGGTIDGIQVGGENILQNTSFQEGLKHWSTSAQDTATVADGVITLKNQSGQRWPRFYNHSPRISEIKKGGIYTLSFEAKGDTRLGGDIAISRADSSNTIMRETVDYSPEWKRYTLTFTASLDWIGGVRLEVWINRDASTSELTTSYRKFKLEKGSVATDWTPAPEDIAESDNCPLIDKINLLLSEPLRSVGDVKDRLFRDSDGLWKVERNVGDMLLKDLSISTTAPFGGGNSYHFGGSVAFIVYSGNKLGRHTYSGFKSSFLRDAGSNNNYNNRTDAHTKLVGTVARINGEDYRLFIRVSESTIGAVEGDSISTLVSKFRGWVTENNASLQYQLANPTIETLPQSYQDKLNNIATYAGSNYLYTIVDKTNILPSNVRENLKPTLHATFKSKAWSGNNAGYPSIIGVYGDSAKMLYLSATAESMTFDADGAPNPSSQEITLTANLQNVSGNASFVATAYNGSTVVSDVVLSGVGNTRTFNQAQFPASANRVHVRATLGNLVDTVTIVKLSNGSKGQNAVVGLLTNESITLPANKDGLVSNFTGASGVFDVYDGITKKTGSGVAYSVVNNSQSNITVNINATTGAYAVTAMPTGTIILNGYATLKAIYNGVTIEKQLNVSKSVTGATGATGGKGADGVAGKDGKGISSTTITYGLSTTDTVEPTNYTSNVPTLVKGQYLWTKTIWTYTDSTTETGYSVSYIAKDGNNGTNGIAGKDGVGITSTSITYVGSTSGTVTPTSGWVAAVPTVAAGSFLWTKTAWTYTDDTNEVGYSVARMGVNGKDGTDGIAGKDGVGLKDTVIEYAQSSSGTVKPTSDWSTDIPSVPSGSYLWTRTTWTYTDNTAENGYTVSRIGKDGNTGKDGIAGKDGVGISGTKVEYAGSTSGTTKPTSVWTLTIPSVAAGNYLWTKTTWTYTDGTNETGYSVAKMGETGLDGESSYTWVRYSPNADGSNMTAEPTSTSKYIGVAITSDNNPPTDYKLYSWALIKGADGRGVKSTDISYQVSASGTTTPTGTWSTTVPAVPKGQYLWTRILITYTDNTNTTSYSISYQGVDGLANIMGFLTNESITLPADSSGSVLTYTGAEGVFEVYEGTNRKTGTPVEYKILSKTNMEVSISTDGAYKISSVSTGSSIRNAYATLRASYGGITIDKQLNLSKAFAGAQGNNGQDGVAGKDGVGIKSTVVNYSQSTSGTTQPTSGWGTAVPTVPAGNYLWTRTVWTYTDNTKETGYTVSRIGKDGNTGKDGIAGKDGVGLQSTKVEYAHSTSGTTAPITGWTLNVPTVPSGSFLWTKSTWTYTDNTTETGYSVARMGSNGATGATGAQGASATSYWITTSNNIISKSQTGTLSPTTITFTGYSKTGTANSALYAGHFIIQTSTNGTTYATRYTSSADQNSYTYTIPADSLFVKCLFYMAGGTTVLLDEQTVPIVESAEGIQVGGEQMLLNTNYEKQPLSWNEASVVINKDKPNNYATVKRGAEKLSYGIYSNDDCEIVNGETYSMSFEVRTSDVPRFNYVYVMSGEGNVPLTPFENIKVNGEWTYYKRTFQSWFNRKKAGIMIGVVGATSGNQFDIRRLKLEKGTVATDWTPAPEDARTYKAWANSADGGADFTRTLPNENLFLESFSSYELGTYAYMDINPELTNLVGKVYEKDSTVDMTGVYFGFTEVGVDGTIGVNWLMDNGILQANASTTGVKSKRRYFSFYPKNEETFDKIKARYSVKLEKGTEATVFTTNTEDSLSGSMLQYIGLGPLDSNNPSEYEWIMNPEYAQALADEALAGKVDNDAEYENLKNMAQEVKESYENFVSEGGEYQAEHSKLLDRTTAIETDLGEYRQQINFVDTYMSTGNEGLIIGVKDSEGNPDANAMQMLLSNKSLSFMDGGEVVAYFSGQSFHINRGAIVESLQVGQHKITNLGNGHTVFQFIG